MKKAAALAVLLATLILVTVHFMIDRRSSIVLVVGGKPAAGATLSELAGSQVLQADPDGHLRRPTGGANEAAFLFRSAPDRNWELRFPRRGTRMYEIDGLDITITDRTTLFGVFSSERQTIQRSNQEDTD